MNKQIVKILGFLFLIGCNNIDYRPKYKDFKNAWEHENLIGKVKMLEQYKANVVDFKTGKTDNPTIEFKKEFSKNGNILYQEHFDNFGKLEEYTKNKFDSKGYRSESITENIVIPSKLIETIRFDTLIGKQVYAHVISNDSIYFEAFFKYDKNGNLIEHKNIQKGDTTLDRIEYKYDKNGNMLSKKQIQNCKSGVNEYLNEFIYDQNGNLIELTSKSEFIGVIKSTYEYDRESRIKKIAQFNKVRIEKETSFDKYYNQILVKFYKDGAINKEMNYEYKFDNKGNWIERKVFMKEYFGQDENWIPVFVETRKLEYYE